MGDMNTAQQDTNEIDLVATLMTADLYQIMNEATGEVDSLAQPLEMAKEYAQEWANVMRVSYAVVHGPAYELRVVHRAKPALRRMWRRG